MQNEVTQGPQSQLETVGPEICLWLTQCSDLVCHSKAGLWGEEALFWILISATNILLCLVTLANDVSLKIASVSPFVH